MLVYRVRPIIGAGLLDPEAGRLSLVVTERLHVEVGLSIRERARFTPTFYAVRRVWVKGSLSDHRLMESGGERSHRDGENWEN